MQLETILFIIITIVVGLLLILALYFVFRAYKPNIKIKNIVGRSTQFTTAHNPINIVARTCNKFLDITKGVSHSRDIEASEKDTKQIDTDEKVEMKNKKNIKFVVKLHADNVTPEKHKQVESRFRIKKSRKNTTIKHEFVETTPKNKPLFTDQCTTGNLNSDSNLGSLELSTTNRGQIDKSNSPSKSNTNDSLNEHTKSPAKIESQADLPQSNELELTNKYKIKATNDQKKNDNKLKEQETELKPQTPAQYALKKYNTDISQRNKEQYSREPLRMYLPTIEEIPEQSPYSGQSAAQKDNFDSSKKVDARKLSEHSKQNVCEDSITEGTNEVNKLENISGLNNNEQSISYNIDSRALAKDTSQSKNFMGFDSGFTMDSSKENYVLNVRNDTVERNSRNDTVERNSMGFHSDLTMDSSKENYVLNDRNDNENSSSFGEDELSAEDESSGKKPSQFKKIKISGELDESESESKGKIPSVLENRCKQEILLDLADYLFYNKVINPEELSRIEIFNLQEQQALILEKIGMIVFKLDLKTEKKLGKLQKQDIHLYKKIYKRKKLPKRYIDHCSKKIMVNPVQTIKRENNQEKSEVAEDNRCSYDISTIRDWISKHGFCDPITNEAISTEIKIDQKLKQEIVCWLNNLSIFDIRNNQRLKFAIGKQLIDKKLKNCLMNEETKRILENWIYSYIAKDFSCDLTAASYFADHDF